MLSLEIAWCVFSHCLEFEILINLYSFIFMSSIPQPKHHQLRNINIFKQLLPLMCFTTFSRSHVLMFKILLLMAFLTTKNSDNTKTPNHRNYQLINASNYWSIFPRKNSFSSLSLFSASFSPSLYVLSILFFVKKLILRFYIFYLCIWKLMALWQLLIFWKY